MTRCVCVLPRNECSNFKCWGVRPRGNLLKECKWLFFLFQCSITLPRWHNFQSLLLYSQTPRAFLSHLYLWWLWLLKLLQQLELFRNLHARLLFIFMNPNIGGSKWTGKCLLSLGLGILVVLEKDTVMTFGFWGWKNKIDVSCDLGSLLWFKCENIPPQSQVLKWASLMCYLRRL